MEISFSWIGKKAVWCTWRRGDRRRRGLLGESALLPLSHCSQCKHFLIVDHEDFPSLQLSWCWWSYTTCRAISKNSFFSVNIMSALISSNWNIFHHPLPAMSVYDVSFEAAEWNVAMQLREAILQKITEFYEIISQTGVNRISYLLFRNSKYPKISG